MNRIGKPLCSILCFTMLLSLAAPPAATATAAFNQLGNTPTNSLDGGTLAEADGALYWAGEAGIHRDDDLLTDEAGANLNIMDGGLYYTVEAGTDSRIRRLDLDTLVAETVLEWAAPIKQLYITDTNLALLLSEGRVYRVDLNDLTAEKDDTAFTVAGFIPTGYGTIYASGELGDYTLYAGDRVIYENAATYFTEDDYLIVRRDATDYQISLRSCFAATAQVSAYSLHEGEVSLHSYSADGECAVCAALEESGETGGRTAHTYATEETYALELTESQENVVKRATQMMYVEWTPQKDVSSWRYEETFEAGVTYQGLPYAQPVSAGAYVPWDASLTDFVDAVNDPDSEFYTTRSANGSATAPYYGTDCSGFVSYALDLPKRATTADFPAYATKITQSLSAVQVGDVFNNAASHNMLVTAVEYDADGNLAAIEIMEQTSARGNHDRYGVDGDYELAYLVTRTFNSGFVLYRSNTIDNVSYTHDHAIYIEGDDCPECAEEATLARYTITAEAGEGGTISPSGEVTVLETRDQTFTFTPNPGYTVSRVRVNGRTVTATDSYTFKSISKNQTISVEFELEGNPFSDVADSDWFLDAVLYTVREGLFNGTSETTFSPYDSITRGQFVTVLGRLAGVDTQAMDYTGVVTGSNVRLRSGAGTSSAILRELDGGIVLTVLEWTYHDDGYLWYKVLCDDESGYVRSDYITLDGGFSDVNINEYYGAYIKWATDLGIVQGYTADSFGPDDDLTREQLCTILYNYCDSYGITLSSERESFLFNDQAKISDWAAEAVTALQQAEVVNGTDAGDFNPQNNSSRADTAQVMMNFLLLLEE